MAVYLPTKFQVSSITLTSFRQGEGVILPLPPLTPKRTSKKATQIRVKIDPLQLFLKSYKFLIPVQFCNYGLDSTFYLNFDHAQK